MGPLETMQMHYERRDLAARKWKEKGGKVVGYLSEDVPEEMILAAGFFPLRISGDPRSGTEEADKYTEPFYDPRVRSIFNLLLTGRYDYLDYIIIPHSSDAILKLYYHLRDAQRIDPAIKFPDLYLFDILHTRFWTTGVYLRDRVRDLKKKLEEWSGKEMTRESLSRAIAIGNENKMLLKKVAGLRTCEPPRLSGVEALQIIGASMVMLKEEQNKLLRRFLDGDSLPHRGGARLFIEGSDIDHLQLYERVESCKATVVSEDHSWGNRYSDDPVDPGLEPLEAIAERYHLKSPSPRMHSIDRRIEYCVQRAVESRAQGVIFYFLEWDSAPAWDYPDQKKALEEKGIPSLCLDMQKYLLTDPERKQMKAKIEQFIEAIQRGQKNGPTQPQSGRAATK